MFDFYSVDIPLQCACMTCGITLPLMTCTCTCMPNLLSLLSRVHYVLLLLCTVNVITKVYAFMFCSIIIIMNSVCVFVGTFCHRNSCERKEKDTSDTTCK